MKAIDDLKEVYPELQIWEVNDNLYICGEEDEVDCADERMCEYFSAQYKRHLLVVDFDFPALSTRTYRRNA